MGSCKISNTIILKMHYSKRTWLGLLFVGFLVLASCKKDTNEAQPTPAPPVIEPVKPLQPAEPGTIRARVNGIEKSTMASTTDAQTTSIVRMEISGMTENAEMLALVLPVKKKPSIYDSITAGRFAVFTSNNPNDYVWTSGANLTITKYDSVNKKISGTFSFTAWPQENSKGLGMKQVTEGTFTDVYIR